MAIQKFELSPREDADYRRCLRELHAEGIDVDAPEAPEQAFALDIMVFGGLASFVFNMPGGQAAYAIELRLVARKSGLILPDLGYPIDTEFDDEIVPESFSEQFPFCRLGQCKYPLAEVLNDRFPLKFHRCGHMIEGVILATGRKPMPKQYLHGMTVPVKLTFVDQFGREISTEPKLHVDRSTKPRPRLVHPGRRPVSSLREPEPNNPDFRPNLNRGRVTDPVPSSPNNRVGEEKGEAETELFASLKRALSQLRQQAAAEAGKQPEMPATRSIKHQG
jgi:hypothetical protein